MKKGGLLWKAENSGIMKNSREHPKPCSKGLASRPPEPSAASRERQGCVQRPSDFAREMEDPGLSGIYSRLSVDI